jgi:N utilization substance protein B
MAGQDVGAIIDHFMVEQDARKFDTEYFAELVRGVPARLTELDAALASCVDRALESVDPVERAILRLGAYELIEHPEIPYRVVINEAVELAKTFGAEKGHRYVNGVLDKAARDLRPIEASARR